MDKKMKQTLIGGGIALLAIAVIGAITLVKYLTPEKGSISESEYLIVTQGKAAIIMDGSIYAREAVVSGDNEPYISLDMVHELMNADFYYDDNEKMVVYAMPEFVVYAGEDEKCVYEDDNRIDLSCVPVLESGGEVYLSAEFVSHYADMPYSYYSSPDRLVITHKYGNYLYADVKEDTVLRCAQTRKAKILRKLIKGETLMLVDGGGEKINGYLNVMTEDGIIAYVNESALSESYYRTLKSEFETPAYTSITADYKINLVFHMTTNKNSNNSITDLLSETGGINTVVPTWYKLSDNSGNIETLADSDYVEKLHALGIQVWGLCSNFDIDVDESKILNTTSVRRKLIKNLVDSATDVGLDGINIDFEMLSSDCADAYIEFIRELSSECRAAELTLSIDNYVPSAYTSFYNRKKQAEVADYIIVMAYDEHYAGSEEAGSVSSISFVKDGIEDTLKEVPKEKIICAIPFYTRLWKETKSEEKDNGDGNKTPDSSTADSDGYEGEVVNNGVDISSESLSMSEGEQAVDNAGVSAEWNDETQQYYASFEKNGSTYEIWLEDAKSIGAKLDAISQYGIAGVGAWRLGLETKDIWDVYSEYMNK